MAKIFGKVKEMMFGEYEDDGGYYEEDMYEEDDAGYEPQQQNHGLREVPKQYENENENISFRRTSAPSQQHGSVASIHNFPDAQTEVVILKPLTYEDAQEVCNQVKRKKACVINLEKVDYPLAQRIMDFLSGACYSLDGRIQRVANNIFLFAPDNIDIRLQEDSNKAKSGLWAK